jgi:putative ABC transport system substrate-binding protein
MTALIGRREFITLLGGAAAAWPFAARGQQGERMRRIGVLIGGVAPDDPDAQANMAAFLQVLQQLAWTEGRNVRIDYRWGLGNADNIRKYAAELAALAPDAIFASGNAAMPSLLQATRTVPIVFVNVADPVGSGFVDSLARPGGNATGFVQFEYNLSGKWLELLKEIAPRVTRAAVLRDPAIVSGIGQFAVIQSVAPSAGVEVSPVNVRDAGEIERAVTAFARASNGGLIVTTSALTVVHRDLIITLAARYKLPAVYYRRYFVTSGGLMSYGYDIVEQFRGAAGYVDRILKGEKPADLPVQTPTKYQLVINLKTAKTLGLEVPPTLLARADEVIERSAVRSSRCSAARWRRGRSRRETRPARLAASLAAVRRCELGQSRRPHQTELMRHQAAA